uniref:Placenta associated 8 n=1 Tax=Anolis carolinensis TaxID=28377 RepID=G1KKF2_ANOCA
MPHPAPYLSKRVLFFLCYIELQGKLFSVFVVSLIFLFSNSKSLIIKERKVCCGMFCYMCLGCQVAADMNECCLCGTSMALRSVYRTRYRIPGSLCDDFCTVLCCPVCSLCQIKRDINRRRELGIF